MPEPTNVQETLRALVRGRIAAGKSLNSIAVSSGVPQSRLFAFMRGGGLRPRNLNRLAAYFALEITNELRPLRKRSRNKEEE